MHYLFRFILISLVSTGFLSAQETLKVKHPERYDANCEVEICIKNKCYKDSIPRKVFIGEEKIELRINENCTIKKKFDVFVSSFEISIGENDNIQIATAQSSFFNNFQKKIIQNANVGQSFTIKNIAIHAPDAFRKMDDMKITLK